MQVEIGFELFDIVSDLLTVLAVNADANAGRNLLFAYISCFGIALVASLYSTSGKLQLLLYKLRKRTSKRTPFVSPQARKAALLEERSDIHKMHLQKALSYLLVAACEVKLFTNTPVRLLSGSQAQALLPFRQDLPSFILGCVYLLSSTTYPAQTIVFVSFGLSMLLLGYAWHNPPCPWPPSACRVNNAVTSSPRSKSSKPCGRRNPLSSKSDGCFWVQSSVHAQQSPNLRSVQRLSTRGVRAIRLNG